MTKYIGNKQIDSKRSNDIEDLKGIGEAFWNLINSVYNSDWEELYVDNNSNSFQQKVTSKFTSKVKKIVNSNKGNKNKVVLASIEKLPPLISAKSPKEVQEILKYFKNLKKAPINQNMVKLYVQASKPVNHIEEVIRIKDAFLSLEASKIDQV